MDTGPEVISTSWALRRIDMCYEQYCEESTHWRAKQMRSTLV